MADRRYPGSRRDRSPRLDQPREARRRFRPSTTFLPSMSQEAFGRASESFARLMGTAGFLIGMTVFVIAWLAWNTYLPEAQQFDPRRSNYTLLTLILSLQASYAAPLILLAQNRQADRDRVALEQDRARDERNLADTEFLTREVAALRIALRDQATRDFVRSELRNLLDELEERGLTPPAPGAEQPERPEKPKKGSKAPKDTPAAATTAGPTPDVLEGGGAAHSSAAATVTKDAPPVVGR